MRTAPIIWPLLVMVSAKGPLMLMPSRPSGSRDGAPAGVAPVGAWPSPWIRPSLWIVIAAKAAPLPRVVDLDGAAVSVDRPAGIVVDRAAADGDAFRHVRLA